MSVLSKDFPDDGIHRENYLNDGTNIIRVNNKDEMLNRDNIFSTTNSTTNGTTGDNNTFRDINSINTTNKDNMLIDTKSMKNVPRQICYEEINKCYINKEDAKIINKEINDEINIVYSYTVNDSKKTINSNNELISLNISVDEDKNYILQKKIKKLPFLRYGHFLCLTKNGCILAIGGTDGKVKYALVEKYCAEEKKWKQINLMHFSRSNFCGICTEDNNLFILGGEGNQHILKSVEYYDNKINAWISLPPLNCVRHSASAIIFKHTIFIIGGKDGIGNYGRVHKSVEMLNLNEQNMKWNLCKPLKQARLELATIVFKDKIYAIGGSTGVKDLSSVEIYDSKTEEWTEGPNLNFARSNFVLFIWKNQLVAYGGINKYNGDFVKNAEILDEKTTSWLKNSEKIA
ncbi:kelch domain-containing protein [Plasmodium brasilianum]|uniref:Kelch domain-containing protein n=1 Tax=Plasmodium brasilianum TaxID=5824 RepID=A0ACB9YGN8_PLABR|nr:kelch domain-containing protein [Plasmodium brasilianum]